jgi:WD40 repeat protein
VFAYNFCLETGELEKVFTTNDHVGKIKDIHVTNDQYLITSGEDENVKIYNLKKNEKLSNIFGL